MNRGTVTGGVIKAADNAYTVATFEAPSRRRVLFTIAISDSQKVRTPWNCEAEGDVALMDKLIANAQPGRGIKVDYELTARPFIDRHGLHKGEVRFLRILAAEFPERPAKLPAPEPEPVGTGT